MPTKKKTIKRKPGRPIEADAQVQRARLLEVSAKIFAEFGPDATSVQQIAESAGVDRKLIYHYFNAKDQLYIEVLHEHYSKLREISGQLAIDADSVEQFMRLLMQRFFAFCVAHPQFVRILAWENLREVRGLEQIRGLGIEKTIMAKLKPLVKQEIAAGRCRPGLDPRKLLVSGLGLCLYPLINQESLALMIGYEASSPKDWDDWINHAVDQIVLGVSK